MGRAGGRAGAGRRGQRWLPIIRRAGGDRAVGSEEEGSAASRGGAEVPRSGARHAPAPAVAGWAPRDHERRGGAQQRRDGAKGGCRHRRRSSGGGSEGGQLPRSGPIIGDWRGAPAGRSSRRRQQAGLLAANGLAPHSAPHSAGFLAANGLAGCGDRRGGGAPEQQAGGRGEGAGALQLEATREGIGGRCRSCRRATELGRARVPEGAARPGGCGGGARRGRYTARP